MDKNIENFFEKKYNELLAINETEGEYLNLYSGITCAKLGKIFSNLHSNLNDLFKKMNERLPTGINEAHYWAEPSRKLLEVIEITLELHRTLKDTKYAFKINDYYLEIIKQCQTFLESNGGSTLPHNMKKIELCHTIPIFILNENVVVSRPDGTFLYPLKKLGVGSYADVFKYKDDFYNKYFALKRAKKDLSEKELQRFKTEYSEMQNLSSPYILEVYCFEDKYNHYIMEYMDFTLDSYINKYNTDLSIQKRKKIIKQILEAFEYIHSKGMLHRDISPKNVLIKCYDNSLIVKISDFGLVKIPDSLLTSINTEFKGYYNDPALIVEGFNSYSIQHETFALTRLIYFVMTGKTNVAEISDSKLKDFVNKGLNTDNSKRFQTVKEMIEAFNSI